MLIVGAISFHLATISVLLAALTSATNVLHSNQALAEGESLISSNGQFKAALQTDGNFVLYHGDFKPLAIFTNNKSDELLRLILKDDGNLVISTLENTTVWETHTIGSNAYLVLQDDGNLVLNSGSSTPLWKTTVDVKKTEKTTNSEIIANADTWLYPPVWYSQSSYYNGYRQDCSGYVSMAWQLGTSATTWSIPNYSFEISKDDLSPGDILLNIDEHVLIFNGWANDARTQYWAYEQTPPQTIYHVVAYPYWEGYGVYVPYRFNGVIAATGSAAGAVVSINSTMIDKK